MDLEGRKFAWIIRVKGTEKNYKQPSFKVFKLTDKPEVIHKFQDNVTMEVCFNKFEFINATNSMSFSRS